MEWYTKIILIYLMIVSIIGVILTIYDKRASKHSARRVPEKTLMLFSAIGAGLPMYLTMHFIRHKTKHNKFMIGIPVIMIFEALVIIGAVYLVKVYV